MPTETYKSKEAYRKARAYIHIHGIRTHADRVCIKGVGCHKVKHSAKSKARKANAKRYGK